MIVITALSTDEQSSLDKEILIVLLKEGECLLVVTLFTCCILPHLFRKIACFSNFACILASLRVGSNHIYFRVDCSNGINYYSGVDLYDYRLPYNQK